jgi:[protein-PII] uridylyltransferase
LSTATFDQLGLTILDARIVTTLDNYVLNSFQILEQTGEPIKELFREVHICTTLRANLLQREVKDRRNIHKQSRQAKHFPIASSIEFHIDPLNKHSVIELITTDHAGLLSKIGQAFIQQNIQLHNAKITTIGSRAEDMFYVTDEQGLLITDTNKQSQIREAILTLLEGRF